MSAQVLDTMDLERERGITIKAHPVRLTYTAKDGQTYILNLIDTPGHVDFSYEVTRSLAACEGALLLVDAVAGRRSADARQRLPRGGEQPRDHPGDQQDRSAERAAGRGAPAARGHHRPRRRRRRFSRARRKAPASSTSSKPSSSACRRRKAIPRRTLKALIFDSWYDAYRGVVIVVRVLEGTIKNGMKVTLMNTRQDHEVESLGVFVAEGDTGRAAGAGRSRLHRVRHQGRGRRADRRHRHRNRSPDAGAVPRLQGVEADGVRGFVSRGKPSVRRAARVAREAAAQRRVVFLRARDVAGARLRLPLRVPRAAAHGDRAGASRARVQHGPRHHGAGRAVPGDEDRRRGDRDRQPGEAAGDRAHRQDRRAGDHAR